MHDRIVEERVRRGRLRRPRPDAQELLSHLTGGEGARRGEQHDGQESDSLHCLFRVSCPEAIAPLHEFEPEYVPVIVDEDA